MIAGDPDAVEAAADALARHRGFTDVVVGIEAAASAALSGWEGHAATAAGEAFTRYRPALAAGDTACHAVIPTLRAYAAELRAAQEEFARAQTTADQAAADQTAADQTAAGQTAADQATATTAPAAADGSATSTGPPPALGPVADEATRAMAAAVDRARIADEQAAAAITQAHGLLAAMTVDAPGAATGAPATTAPPTAADEPGLLSTLGHTALDVVGLVPVVGEAADLANAAWYGLEGDHVAAGLSLAAAIPIAGWLFTGGKLGLKGATTIKAVTDTDAAAAWVKGRPSMVPWNAKPLTYKGVGERYRWKDPATGKSVTYHAHPADPSAPAGSNSASGPTYRLEVGNHHLDANGTRYTKNQLDERSPVYDAPGANATHIPYPTNQPVGWGPGRRVFVPNTASLADGTGEQSGSSR